jgi:hypothetical protein
MEEVLYPTGHTAIVPAPQMTKPDLVFEVPRMKVVNGSTL